MIAIDGSQGEGGGQVLRTALALSCVTATPFRMEKIRARRRRPGLARQHLAAVRAAAAVSGARLDGAELGSSHLWFEPGEVRAGNHHFAVETAGSACLVLQTVLWPLLVADGPSRVVFEGGTHNPLAPPFDFIAETFLPVLRRMGARVEARLERCGFYPAGGGRFVVELEGGRGLQPVQWLEAGPIARQGARVLLANLPRHIAERERKVLCRELGLRADACRVEAVESAGPGNVVLLSIEREPVTETIVGFGERGVRAEQVARGVVRAARRYLDAGVPVGEHLADQLLIPVALAGGGAFVTLPLSGHATTNIEIVGRFLPVRIEVVAERAGRAARVGVFSAGRV